MSRGRGPRSIADSVARITKPFFAKRGFADGTIISDWATIIGPELAAHSLPEKIVFAPSSRDNGTLHLRIDSGSFAVELQHLEPALIEKINTYFGYRAVAKVRISQGPTRTARKASSQLAGRQMLGPNEERRLSAQLAGIDDTELRETLEKLGRSLASRRNEKS